jgi:hypothetical protein
MKLRFRLEKSDFQSAIAGALDAADLPGKANKAFEALGAIGHGGQAFQFFGKFQGEALLRVRLEPGGLFFRVGIGAFRREFAEPHAPLLFPQPILKAAAPPFGNVVFGDGPASEALGESVFDFGQRVQPGDEVFAERAVVEAAV